MSWVLSRLLQEKGTGEEGGGSTPPPRPPVLAALRTQEHLRLPPAA